MTLLLLLRPKRDHHEPGEIKEIFDRLKKRYEKKLAKKAVKKKVEKAPKIEAKESKIEEPSPNLSDSYKAELEKIVGLREKLLSLKDVLENTKLKARLRRAALAELAIRDRLFELLQQEEDEAIILMLWELV